MSDFMVLLFHSVGFEIFLIPLILLDLFIAPCIWGVAIYRIWSGRITDTVFRKSLYSLGTFGVVSFLIYCAFESFVIVQSGIQFHYFLYCLSFPFGLVWAVGAALYLDSTIIGVVFGFFVNLMCLIGVLSFWENRKSKHLTDDQ